MASRSSADEKKPKRQQKTQVYESEGEESEDYAPPQRRRGQRQMQQQQQGPLDNLQLGNVGQTAGGLVGGVTNTLGGVAGNAVDQKGGGGKSDTLRLRLDLNLDIEITLKAKIHGDLELALLYVDSLFSPPLPPAVPTSRTAVYSPCATIPEHLLQSYPSCFLLRLKVHVEKLEQETCHNRHDRARGTREEEELGASTFMGGSNVMWDIGSGRRALLMSFIFISRCFHIHTHHLSFPFLFPLDEQEDATSRTKKIHIWGYGANSLGTEATSTVGYFLSTLYKERLCLQLIYPHCVLRRCGQDGVWVAESWLRGFVLLHNRIINIISKCPPAVHIWESHYLLAYSLVIGTSRWTQTPAVH